MPGILALVVYRVGVQVFWQYYAPTGDVLRLLDVFRRMVNDSIRIGLVNDASSLRRLSLLSYNQLARLSRRETRGSSVCCPRCGERLQSDKRLGRKLWCGKCRVVMDRDRVA